MSIANVSPLLPSPCPQPRACSMPSPSICYWPLSGVVLEKHKNKYANPEGWRPGALALMSGTTLACRSVQAHTCTYILPQALGAGEYTVTHLQSSRFLAPTAEEPLAPENSSHGASFHMSVPVAAVNFDTGVPVVHTRTRPRCITTVLLFPTSPEVQAAQNW